MSVHYPGNGPKNRSQERDHLIGVASRYFREHISDPQVWRGAEGFLMERHRLDFSKAQQIALVAVLDLEWENAIMVTPTGLRAPQPGDPAEAKLSEVAAAVMGLGWSAETKARKIRECATLVWPRFRHCDVYWAMHEVLKGNQLRCNRAYWKALVGVNVDPLDDPTLTVEERELLIQQIEAELVTDYIAWLGYRVQREWRLGTRSADIYDARRRLVIEAKAEVDDKVVLGAVAQAALYRRLANREGDTRVDPIAVLLPEAPSPLVHEVLEVEFDGLQVGFIWPDDDGFVEDFA